jgi:hypothetical protein
MITVNSLSGGKTSSYIAKNYPADYNVFSLVRTDDKNCLFPDAKIRQMVSDRIGTEFIGTLEEDAIIYTMLDLEQFIGSKIDWVSGKTFDNIIKRSTGNTYLPTLFKRFCTEELKVNPIKEFWYKEIKEIVSMRIGFRANETIRANKMIKKCKKNGIQEDKFVVAKTKNGRNKWKTIEWRVPEFPLIKDNIYKDDVVNYWKGKNVRFAFLNNCVGCFHRNEILLNKMSRLHPNKMEWFASKERTINKAKWKDYITYDQIIAHNMQTELFDDDFNDCDSGYCGL